MSLLITEPLSGDLILGDETEEDRKKKQQEYDQKKLLEEK